MIFQCMDMCVWWKNEDTEENEVRMDKNGALNGKTT